MIEKTILDRKLNPILVLEFDNIRYGFNPKYILDMLKVVKNPKIYLKDNKSPMYIYGDNANAIILEVRIAE